MPNIHAKTPRQEYQIAGQKFSVAQPYAEGHSITAGEAAALNQCFAENMRNNFAGTVKSALEADSYDHEIHQAMLDDRMGEYEFGQRRAAASAGGRPKADPVEVEALLIAKEKVRRALRAKGHALKDVPAAEITRLAKDVLTSGRYPEILEAAAARVAAQQEVADIEIGELAQPIAAE